MLYLLALAATQVPQDVVVYNAAPDPALRAAWAGPATALRQRLEARGRAFAVPAEVAAALEGHDRASAEEVDLREARDAFARFEHARALALLNNQERTALAALRDAHLREAIADIALLRGQVALAAEDKGGAARAFRLYARCAPQRPALDPAKHPPAVIRAAEANATAAEGTKGALAVAGLPTGGQLFVNGAPAAESLAPGPHLLTAQAPGYQPHAEIIDVPSGVTVDLRLALRPSTPAQRVQAARRRGDPHAALEAAGAPAALILQPLHDRRALVHRRLASGETSETVPISRDRLDAALALIGPELVAEAPRGEPRTAWYERWWVWTALGVVAAAGATTGVVLATRGDDAPPTVTCCGP